MKPIPKIFIFFVSALILASASYGQESSDWVQENWQRVSGEVDGFQDRFPANSPTVQPAVHQMPANGSSSVRQADHQAPDPGAAFTQHGGEMQGMQLSTLSTTDELGPNEMSPADWTADLQGQFNKIQWPKVLSSLAIVVGGYFGFVWFMRKLNPKMNSGLPSEVFELIGTTRLNAKQTLQLVRLGSKLLLLVHGDEGTHPIAEITDPGEVEHLTELCSNRTSSRRSSSAPARSTRGGSGFRNALDRANREGDTTEAAMDKVIRKLSELAGKSNRTDFEA